MKTVGKKELIAILLIAGSSRPLITSFSPQITAIRNQFGFSVGQFGFLTTIILICFAFAAPIPYFGFSRRISANNFVLIALAMLSVSAIIRVMGGSLALILGTFGIGIATAILNVMTPPIIRRDFPTKITTVLPLFTSVLAIVSSCAAGLSVALSTAFSNDWRWGVTAWVVFPIAALALWFSLHLGKQKSAAVVEPTPWKELLKNRKSWTVTIYFGIQSCTFYSTIAWLPQILMDRGFSAARAGALLGITTFSGFIFTLVLPLTIGRTSNQKVAVIATSLPAILGFLGVNFASATLLIPSLILMGVGHASLPVALVLIAMQAPRPELTGPLSAMSQGIGYAMAACVPVGIGFIYAAAGTWTIALNLLVVLTLLQCLVGLKAAR